MSGKCQLTDLVSNKIRNMSSLCAFLVVIIHCRPHFGPGTVGWWLKEFLENGLTHIAVPFFFVVSGYMLAREVDRDGYCRPVAKRTRTLILPFVLWNLLFYVFDLGGLNVLNFIKGRDLTLWLPTMKQLGIWHTGCPLLTPLWYVRAVFVLCVIFPALLWCIKKGRLFFLAGLLAVYGFVCPFAPLPEWGAVEDFARLGILPVLGVFYFCLGIAIYEGVVPANKIKLQPAIAFVIGVALFLIKAYLAYNGYRYVYYIGFIGIPFALYGTYGLVGDKLWPKWLVMSSFGVYVLHKFVLLILKQVIAVDKNIVTYLGSAVVSFAISLMFVLAVKKLTPQFAKILLGGR